MGWTVIYDREAGMSDRDFFEREFRGHLEFLASATVGNVFYAAARSPAAPDVFALVILLRRGQAFGWKTLDENMYPGVFDAPAAVLAALTPTNHPEANAWRERCREQLARKQAAGRVRTGDVVEFAEPLNYGNRYGQHRRLAFVQRSTFRLVEGPHAGLLVRVTGWKSRALKV